MHIIVQGIIITIMHNKGEELADKLHNNYNYIY